MKNKISFSKTAIFIGFIAMIALFFIFINNNQQNTVYMETETTYAATTVAETYETTSYLDECNQFCINVIKDWTKVILDNSVQFVHSPSNSNLVICTYDYTPNIHLQSEDNITPDGAAFISFKTFDNNKILYQYQTDTDDGLYDIIVFEIWDLDKIVEFTFNIKDQYYDKLSPKISYMIDSVYFKPTNAIPDNFFIQYDPVRNYSFTYKSTWTISSFDNGYIFFDDASSMNITIEWYKSDENTEYITQIDYTNFASKNRAGFCLTSFNNSGSGINAEATYKNTSGNTYYMNQYIICTGVYEFIISIDYPTAQQVALSSDLGCFLNLFTIYSFDAPSPN